MPRRPKPPPAGYDMHVEGLSEPKQTKAEDEYITCEFTGELIRKQVVDDLRKPKPMVKVITNYRRLQKAQKLKAEQDAIEWQRKRNEKAEQILQRMELLKTKTQAEPKLAHNQVLTQSGLVLTPKRGPNALKRRF